MSIDVEYAIKKDVRNNPIVREVDWQQKREFLRAVGIGALIVVMLLLWAWPQLMNRLGGYQLSDLRRELAVEEELNRKLRLELETLRSPQRLEERAIKELHMTAPGSAGTIVIERATPVAPSRAVIAKVR
jgi:cell division protein FtsL